MLTCSQGIDWVQIVQIFFDRALGCELAQWKRNFRCHLNIADSCEYENFDFIVTLIQLMAVINLYVTIQTLNNFV